MGGRQRRATARRAAIGVLCASACAGTPASQAQEIPTATGGYVAMGDSFSAGTGIAPMVQSAGVTSWCWQSARSYPELVAAALRLPTFTDETCAGAEARHLAARQFGEGPSSPPWVIKNGPQFDALRDDTSLVTVGLGLNDIGYAEILATCLLSSCERHFHRRGGDVLRDRIARLRGALAGAIASTHARSPRARVLIVGYPWIFPARGSCVAVPFTPAEMSYLSGVLVDLNRALRETAVAAGAEYVDLEAPSAQRDACERPSVRWVEPFVVSPTVVQTLHPNARGARGAAEAVLRVVG